MPKQIKLLVLIKVSMIFSVILGIVNDPIILTIYSSDCPDLTIIDLPGITRIPLKGTDQKVDIE